MVLAARYLLCFTFKETYRKRHEMDILQLASSITGSSKVHRRGTLTAVASSSLAVILLLGGCSGTAERPAQDSNTATTEQPAPSESGGVEAAVDAGSATASIDGREFTFMLSNCMMYEGEEVELSGAGGETGADAPSYLDGGLMQMDADVTGEFRISIGTDQPFDSTNEFLALGAPTGEGLTVVKDGDGYLATGNAWNDQGADLGTGTLRFACS